MIGMDGLVIIEPLLKDTIAIEYFDKKMLFTDVSISSIRGS